MKKILLVILLLAFVGAACNTNDDRPTRSTGSYDVVETGPDISGNDLVVFMEKENPGYIAEFCSLYYQIGDYDSSLAAFTDGYGATTTNPTAREVFNALLAYC